MLCEKGEDNNVQFIYNINSNSVFMCKDSINHIIVYHTYQFVTLFLPSVLTIHSKFHLRILVSIIPTSIRVTVHSAL